jgi:redox-sensitive bicupin YhaK (pirin superfamily)
VRADQRHFSDAGWQKSFWLFSFSNYHDPANVRFGCLRVFNEEVLDPGRSAPGHTHRDMDILTLVLRGELTHVDNQGNETLVKEGEVHCLSAGQGVPHRVENRGTVPAHFHKLWFAPENPLEGTSQEQRFFLESARKNLLLPVASGKGLRGAIRMNSDATVYLASLDPKAQIRYETGQDRSTFIYVTRGTLTVCGTKLLKCDQARLTAEPDVRIASVAAAEFVLIDLPGEEEE